MSPFGLLLWWLAFSPSSISLSLFNVGGSELCQGKPSSAISHLQLNGFNFVPLGHYLWCKTAKIPTVFPLNHAGCSFTEAWFQWGLEVEPKYSYPATADGKKQVRLKSNSQQPGPPPSCPQSCIWSQLNKNSSHPVLFCSHSLKIIALLTKVLFLLWKQQSGIFLFSFFLPFSHAFNFSFFLFGLVKQAGMFMGGSLLYSLRALLRTAAFSHTVHRMSPVFHGNSMERAFTR